jgi:hypothetical protein
MLGLKERVRAMINFATKLGIAIAGAALLAGAGAVEAKPRISGEERLAKLLEGRTAGRPVSCIQQMDRDNLQIIDKTALVYGSGRTLYVNRPRNANDIDSNDILVTRLHSSQLCRLDTVHLRDRAGGGPMGFLMLGDFVPYRRVDSAHR